MNLMLYMFSLIIDMLILFKCYRREKCTAKIAQVIGLPMNAGMAVWGVMIRVNVSSDVVGNVKSLTALVLAYTSLRILICLTQLFLVIVYCF